MFSKWLIQLWFWPKYLKERHNLNPEQKQEEKYQECHKKTKW